MADEKYDQLARKVDELEDMVESLATSLSSMTKATLGCLANVLAANDVLFESGVSKEEFTKKIEKHALEIQDTLKEVEDESEGDNETGISNADFQPDDVSATDQGENP